METYILALLIAFIWGFVPFLEKLGLSHTEPATAYLIRCSGVIIGAITTIVIYNPITSIGRMSFKSVFLIVTAGILAGFVAQFMFYKAIKTGEISKIIPITSCYPIFTFILGWAFMGEDINLTKILGALLILAGIILLR